MKSLIFKTALLSIIFFNTQFIFAQGWEKTFTDGFGEAKGFDVIETQDGGYVMVGELDLPTGAIRHHIWAVKTDIDGNELWSNIYGYFNVSYYEAKAVAETSDGDLLIAGSNYANKATVLKLNADGDSIWTKCFGGEGFNAFKDIIKTENGDFILVGQYEAEVNSQLHEVWAMGMNANGDSLWSETYLSPSLGSELAMDISALSSNEYLITGGFEGKGFSIRINGSSGAQIWENFYQLSSGDFLLTSAVNNTGDKIYLGGASAGIAGYTPSLVEVDAAGIFQNLITASNVNFGTVADIVPTSDDGFILTGSSYDFWYTIGFGTGFISKLNADLEIEWEITYEDTASIQGAAIRQNSDGSYILAGSKEGGLFLKKIGGIPNATHGFTINGASAKVYPNPAIDQLFIEIPEEVFEQNMDIRFYDSIGKLVTQTKLKDRIQIADIAGFTKGFYSYVILSEGKGLFSGKFLVH